MNITQATLTDSADVLQIFAKCISHMESNGIFQWDAIYPALENVQADIGNKSLYVGKEDSGELIAAFALDEESPGEYASVDWKFSANRVAVVHRLAVDPTHQGRGLAKQLMSFAERLARSQGCEAMRLDAFTKNPAPVALYDSLGYSRAGAVIFRKGSFYCFEKRLV
jgi:GNAT superfamily N-acetyltransferase